MTKIMLVAPIGTREVRLIDERLLPNAVRAEWGHADPAQRLGARAMGTLLRGDLERFGPAIELQIVGKALRHLVQRHERVDRLVLVATDQKRDETPERYWKNDTIELAILFRDLLRRDHNPAIKRVGDGTKIATVRENPADYALMRDFYRSMLPERTADLSADGICYLEVTGGTSQLSVMLLLEGMRLLRSRAIPLYAFQELDMPLHLNVGQQILVDDLRATVARDIGIYAYHAAWKSCVTADSTVREAIPHLDALTALLDSARSRLNFDFLAAQRVLFGAKRRLPAPLRRAFLKIADDLRESARTEAWLTGEVYQSALIQLEIEAFAGFVGRIFRLQEALLRHLCVRWGARFSVDDENTLDPDWLSTTELDVVLTGHRIAIDQTITRWGLQRLAMELARRDDNKQGLDWVETLTGLNGLAELRNKSIITHGFAGISREMLDKACGKGRSVDEMMASLGDLLVEVLGVDPGASPYAVINELCLRLIDGSDELKS